MTKRPAPKQTVVMPATDDQPQYAVGQQRYDKQDEAVMRAALMALDEEEPCLIYRTLGATNPRRQLHAVVDVTVIGAFKPLLLPHDVQ